MTYQTSQFNLSDAGGADRVRGAAITRDFTRVLGLQPLLGRTFTADEDRPKGRSRDLERALVALTLRRRPECRRRSIRLDGATATVVGVMPADASFPSEIQLWVPMAGDPADVRELLGRRDRPDDAGRDCRRGGRRHQARASADLGHT